jgi:hypothetical protein
MVVTRVGTTVSLRCSVEASPRSVNYWVQRGRDKDDLGKKNLTFAVLKE